MKNLLLLPLLLALYLPGISQENSARKEIDQTLDNWHRAAAEADFDSYFDLMTSKGVFLGTDATENWSNEAFREYSRPHFERGNAWSFRPLERNIYLGSGGCIAWFDELLETQMGICRGSGVLEQSEGQWKIAHYVLSIAIPNEQVGEVTRRKREKERDLIQQLILQN